MQYLTNHPHQQRETGQCNYAQVLFDRAGIIVGMLYCPKDVWAEMRALALADTGFPFAITFEIVEKTEGYYCPQHFMKILPGIISRNRQAETKIQKPFL